MLTVENLQAAYGAARVLFDISFGVGEGEMVTLLGRNGMGKTTTISTIMGLLRSRGGRITFGDARLDGLPPHRVAQAGLGLVPEGRQIFPTLNVEENLNCDGRGALRAAALATRRYLSAVPGACRAAP